MFVLRAYRNGQVEIGQVGGGRRTQNRQRSHMPPVYGKFLDLRARDQIAYLARIRLNFNGVGIHRHAFVDLSNLQDWINTNGVVRIDFDAGALIALETGCFGAKSIGSDGQIRCNVAAGSIGLQHALGVCRDVGESYRGRRDNRAAGIRYRA